MSATEALISTGATLWQLAATFGPWLLLSFLSSAVLIRFFHIK